MSFHPDCFDDADQYREWRKSGVTAGEYATPCMDCSAKYKAEMGERCKPTVVKMLFEVNRNATKPVTPKEE